MKPDDRWLSIKDAARAVSVSDSTVRRYIRQGAVKIRLGLVRLSEVQEAEAAARRRQTEGRKSGGARGKWLSEKAAEFLALQGADESDRSIIDKFVVYARA